MFKKIIIGLIVVFFCFGAVLFLFGRQLSARIEERFSGRRWSIPSKVFSDTTLLFPGQQFNRDLLLNKLFSLGYQEVFHRPEKKGEMQIGPTEIEIYLHDFKTPWQERAGFGVRLTTGENIITSIVGTDPAEIIPLLELEPEEISLFFGPERERRQLVSIQQVPRHLIFAVLAIEDARFYQHHGVDLLGISRALWMNLRHGAIRQGGSTVTQQLAKNYFLTPTRTLRRKLQEILLAVVMELKYQKDEILEIYLNEIYLGQKGSVAINGVGEAAWFYFGKPVGDLSRAEGSVIAGLIKAPNHYSPYQDSERCRSRRDTVLHAMHAKGWISRADLLADLQLPVKTVGYSVQEKKAPYYVDYLEEQLKELYQPEDLTSLGLSIYTTLDTQVQKAAEKALTEGLARLESSNPALQRQHPDQRLQGAIVVMQPRTGYVLAMIGGRSYSASQYNRITQARRQPGSAFKPFVYASALDVFTPATMLSNQPQTYTVDGHIWEPQNFEPVTQYTVSVRDALKMSYNLATVDLAIKTGLDHIVALASRFHFSTSIKPFPSLALGAFEVIPMELARAYCVFPAEGVQPHPLTLKSVVAENGDTLAQKHLHIERLISPAKAFIMNSMLQSVVTEGTARTLKNYGVSWPVAGKTGTTNDFKDAWFVGYTPDILALVWVGFDNGDPMRTTGSAAALPIWADLMNAIPQYISKDGFSIPTGVEKRTVCTVTGLLAVETACPESVDEYFLSGNVPAEFCQLHTKSGLKDLFNRIKKLFNDN